MDTCASVRREADSVMRDRFGVLPQMSTLTMHTAASWQQLKREHNRIDKPDFTTVGMYLPASREAHVLRYERWIGTLYHELHGHGLYYERSSLARHPAAPGWGTGGSAMQNSEGFATWIEEYLCKATGRDRLWRDIRAAMPADYRRAHELATDTAARYSPWGFLHQMGIPITIGNTRAEGILRAATGNRRVELAMFSADVSLVRATIVSDDVRAPHGAPWLDIDVLPTERFIASVKEKDTTMADRLMHDAFLWGDEYAWRRARACLTPS